MRRLIFLLVLLAAIGGAGYWWTQVHVPASAQTAARNRRPDRIPVMVAEPVRRDVPIYLDGLGTVQASAMVTMRAQVDGTLIEVRFREGQDVHAGDVLARIDPRTYQAALDQAVAKKAQDQATLANARIDLVRYTKLAATAYTSAQQADTQKSLVAQLEAQVGQDQAQIDNARAQLSYTTITAPVDGRVGVRLVDQGNLVHASDTTGLLVITTLRPIDVVFTLPQQNLAAVTAAMQNGMPAALALPQGGDEAAVLDHGRLLVLDNQVDATTGTIRLKAEFPNDKLQLWPGGFVTVRLHTATERNALTVPPVALQRGPAGAYVYVVNADQTAARRAVKLGHEDQLVAIVTDGLRDGERVVIDGASRLTDGAKVDVVAPAATSPPSAAGPPLAATPNESQTAGRRRTRGAT